MRQLLLKTIVVSAFKRHLGQGGEGSSERTGRNELSILVM